MSDENLIDGDWQSDGPTIDWENIDPYTVRHGPWGGWGNRERWFRAMPELPPGNVYEMSWDFRTWHRVWEPEKKAWRPVTQEEVGKLPPIKATDTKPFQINFDTITTPAFTGRLWAKCWAHAKGVLPVRLWRAWRTWRNSRPPYNWRKMDLRKIICDNSLKDS